MQRSLVRQIVLAATLALPAALQAQQAPPSPQQQAAQQEVRGWLTEMEELHEKLEALQVKALEDPQVASAQRELGESIKSAMEKIDPTLEASMKRVEELQAQAMAAEQKGDEATLQQLVTQLQQIERQFITAQQQALQQPDLANQMMAFQSRMEKKMAEVDPNAAKLIARFQELEQKLSAAMMQQVGAQR